MYFTQTLVTLLSALATVQAVAPPTYSGFTKSFEASFMGKADTLPHPSWSVITGDRNDNNEYQRFTSNKANIRHSGSGSLQIIPRRDSSAPRGWTSARIENKNTITPRAGRITRIEASIRIGGNAAKNKQGIWPAFWMMGDAFRHGASWPGCGEVDIFENINGQNTVFGVAHCDKYPGGACNEPEGLVAGTGLNDDKYHVWRIEFDRRNSDFRKQTMTWYMDGKQYHRVTGQQVNNAAVWATIAQKPLYFILNVSVGGNWVSPEPFKLCIALLTLNSLVRPTPTPTGVLAA